LPGSLHSIQVSRWSLTMVHTNSSVASVQGGDRSLYYEISSMGGSDDTCAIVCISGSGAFYRPLALHIDAEVPSGPRLDLERYPQLASLAKNATSIRLFHLRSIETYESKLSFSDSRGISRKLTSQPSTILNPFSRDTIHPR